MPALSIATSVPVPMAMPTSACASAGASLIPSPAIATLRPSAWSRFDLLGLLVGQHLGADLVEPEPLRDGLGRGAVVAGEHDEADSRGLEVGDGPGRRLLDRVGDAEQARRPAVDDDEDDRLAVAAQGLGSLAERAGSIPSSCSIAALPIDDRSALDAALHAPAGPRAERLRGGDGEPALAAAPATAAARGCSLDLLEPGGQAEQLRLRPGRATATIETTRGFPSVSVPVLSKTRVSTRSRTSSASAFFTSTPAAAPRPVPTMIDIGVASPSAHGQAMIRTATALTSACASRGSGPMIAQATNVMSATRITPGHEIGRDLVGQALDRRRVRRGLADHPDDLGQHRLGADPLGPHDQRRRCR